MGNQTSPTGRRTSVRQRELRERAEFPQGLSSLSEDGQLRSKAADVGRRLGAELGCLMELIPREHRSVRASAAYLKIDANLTQKVIAATKVSGGESLQVLRSVPGIDGLKRFVEAALDTLGEQGAVASSAMQAVDSFAQLVHECGGTHLRLQQRVDEWLESGEGESAGSEALYPGATIGDPQGVLEQTLEAARRQVYLGVEQLCGKSMRASHEIVVVHRLADDNRKFRGAVIRAGVGYRAQAYAQPYVIEYATERTTATAEHAYNPGDVQRKEVELVEALCSTPSPTLSHRYADNREILVLDSAANARGACDFVTLKYLPEMNHPASYTPTEDFSYSISPGTPCRELVLDVYVEQAFLMGVIPSVQFHRPKRGTAVTTPDWYDFLPGGPVLQILGARDGALSWPRHSEATRYLFERLGRVRDQFVGFRMHVLYPLWGAYYRVNFDFRKLEGAASIPGVR